MHNFTSAQMQQLLGSPEVQRMSPAARQRLTWIADFVQNGRSISETCAQFGIARSTFHRWMERFDPADLASLEERAHDPYVTRTSTIPTQVVELIRAHRKNSPLIGKEKIRELLMQEHGIDLSSSTIGRMIEREGMYYGSTPLHWRKRAQHARVTGEATVRPTIAFAAQTSVNPPATTQTCTCTWCWLRANKSSFFVRSLALTSMLANIAFISMFLATAFWEKQEQDVRASLIDHDHSVHSSLSHSTDER